MVSLLPVKQPKWCDDFIKINGQDHLQDNWVGSPLEHCFQRLVSFWIDPTCNIKRDLKTIDACK